MKDLDTLIALGVQFAILSLFAIVSGTVSIVARPLAARTAMALGAFASATGMGMGLLALAVGLHGLPAFLLATAMAGAGYSLLFLSGLLAFFARQTGRGLTGFTLEAREVLTHRAPRCG